MRLLRACTLATVSGVLTTASSAPAVRKVYSTWMLESIIARGEGVKWSNGLLGGIQKGLFQEAIRAAIDLSNDTSQREKWKAYHNDSVRWGLNELLDAGTDSLAPLDRLCTGVSLLQADFEDTISKDVLRALRQSIDFQLRNQNGGYWYFADPPAPYENYANLSYSDGMYALAPFAALYGATYGDCRLNAHAALEQLEIIYDHAYHADTGLLVHGYDGARAAPWVDPITGASPVVWGRSLAWFTIGLVNTVEILKRDLNGRASSCRRERKGTLLRLEHMLDRLLRAEIKALQKSAQLTGRYGIWQVVDRPGDKRNFVEASATAMVVYAATKALRLGYLPGGEFEPHEAQLQRVGSQSILFANSRNWAEYQVEIIKQTYNELLENFVVENDGLLDFHNTSVIASLHEKGPYYEYYVGKDTITNSLIGSSAFVLASLEIEHYKST